jgi:hypothetical protein
MATPIHNNAESANGSPRSDGGNKSGASSEGIVIDFVWENQCRFKIEPIQQLLSRPGSKQQWGIEANLSARSARYARDQLIRVLFHIYSLHKFYYFKKTTPHPLEHLRSFNYFPP